MNTAVAVCHIILFHLSMGFGVSQNQESSTDDELSGCGRCCIDKQAQKWMDSNRIACDLGIMLDVIK